MDCRREGQLTEKAKKVDQFSSIDALENDDYLVMFTSDSGHSTSISLAPEDIQQIKKLEQYAIMAVHRIGEFRVG